MTPHWHVSHAIRHLAERGLSDRQVAEALGGLTPEAVRQHRRRHGIPAGVPPGGSSLATGWEQRLTALHGQRLTTRQIAESMGWSYRTTQQHMHEIGLRAWR